MTQKAIARECADWIKEKVTFKSNISDKTIQGQINNILQSKEKAIEEAFNNPNTLNKIRNNYRCLEKYLFNIPMK